MRLPTGSGTYFYFYFYYSYSTSTSDISRLKISRPEKNSSRVILAAHKGVGFFAWRIENPFVNSFINWTIKGLEVSIVLIIYLLLSSYALSFIDIILYRDWSWSLRFLRAYHMAVLKCLWLPCSEQLEPYLF